MESLKEMLDYVENQEIIRTNLIKVMSKHAVSFTEIARSSGLSTATITNFIHGKRLSLRTLCAIDNYIQKQDGI